MLHSDHNKLVEYCRRGLYPTDLIYRLLTMNRPETSATARQVGIQFVDSKFFVAHDFNRDNLEDFRQRMSGALRVPESMHMAFFKEKSDDEGGWVALRKELVFDMDITDFVRFCPCHGKKQLCQVCWTQIAGAHLILDEMLRAWHGYEKRHLLWVFSGGKGLHCLVNAPHAITLGAEERMRLHERLFIDALDDERLIARIRQFDEAFLERIHQFFMDRAFKESDLFVIAGPEEGGETFEAFCLRHLQKRYPSLYTHIKTSWESMRTSPITKKIKSDANQSPSEETLSTKKWRLLLTLEKMQNTTNVRASIFLMMRILYPMVDKEPLRMMHQIKLPFSIHASSKNIALPLDSEAITAMNVTRDPLSLNTLLRSKSLPPQFMHARKILEKWLEQYG